MAELQLAISERVANRLFRQLRDKFAVSHADSEKFGPFSASYSVGLRLENGKIDFRSDGTVLIDELDIVYDPLKLTLGIDVPEITLGGFCIIPTPWGCALRAPKIVFFDDDPDFSVTADLSGVIVTEVSASCGATFKHFDDPANAGLSPWAALAAGHPDKWRISLQPAYVDLDLIDIADTVGNLIDKLIDAAVDKMLGFLPDWAVELAKSALGGFSSLIRALLDIGNDVEEWLAHLLGTNLGLFNKAVQSVLQFFAQALPIFEFDDPFPMLPTTQGPGGSGVLTAVLMPILSPAAAVNDQELVVSASVGPL